MTRAIGNGSCCKARAGWKELDLRGPVAIFPEIGMCPLLSSEYAVIQTQSLT
jgi:hypothetical protein